MYTDLRILVMLLLDTLPMLGNVLLLCFFVFFIFGIVGVQLWAGLLRQRCVLELPDNISAARCDVNKPTLVNVEKFGAGHCKFIDVPHAHSRPYSFSFCVIILRRLHAKNN